MNKRFNVINLFVEAVGTKCKQTKCTPQDSHKHGDVSCESRRASKVNRLAATVMPIGYGRYNGILTKRLECIP